MSVHGKEIAIGGGRSSSASLERRYLPDAVALVCAGL
jgi:hypothetical protein